MRRYVTLINKMKKRQKTFKYLHEKWLLHGSKLDELIPINNFHKTWFTSWDDQRIHFITYQILESSKFKPSKSVVYIILLFSKHIINFSLEQIQYLVAIQAWRDLLLNKIKAVNAHLSKQQLEDKFLDCTIVDGEYDKLMPSTLLKNTTFLTKDGKSPLVTYFEIK